MVIASLVPQDIKPQLKGHLKGAASNGVTKKEVMAVTELKRVEWLEGARWLCYI